MTEYDYRGALSVYLEAKELASAIGDEADLAAVDANLSSLYQQIYDMDSALRAGDEALTALHKAGSSYYTAQVLLQIGRVHSSAGEEDAEALFQDGIRAAKSAEVGFKNQNFAAVEAQGWDLLGGHHFSRHDLPGAESAYQEALHLRRLSVPRDLGYSYARLAELRLEQVASEPDPGRKQSLLREARWNIEVAVRAQAAGAVTLPLYQLRYQQGKVLLAEGKPVAGLEVLQDAVVLAQRWRLGIPRTFSSLDGSTAELDERVTSSFVQAAADYGIATGDPRWVRASFEASESDRVLGLKESQALADIWRRKLPIEFWETLNKLRTEDASLLHSGQAKSAESDRLRLRLTEMESQAGMKFLAKQAENLPTSDSLTHFQTGLRNSEALLSFDLERSGSYVWAVTRSSLNAYRLPPKQQIAESVREFRLAIENGSVGTEELGQRLYQSLLGQLRPEEESKQHWLLSLDGALFDLPFAALVPSATVRQEQGRRGIVYLVELHSLEVVPGAFRSTPGEASRIKSSGGFLGVGDPVYNTADPRWSGTRLAGLEGQFNRLPGAGREVETSARTWRMAGRTVDALLEGSQARRQDFVNRLSRDVAVIHLATHVITPPENPGQAYLAFGLNEQGQSELLPTVEVAMLQARGALVVMTGCGTALGNPRPGVGLQGLTRAWSIAGARATLATLWHIKDSSGSLFASFYQHLVRSSVAESLRQAQLAFIHSGTALSAPSEWAAYQVFQGAQ